MIKMTCSLVTSMGRRKGLSPRWASNPRPPRYRLDTLILTELRDAPGELGHFLGSYVTRVLQTARISNVENIITVINNNVKFYAR